MFDSDTILGLCSSL